MTSAIAFLRGINVGGKNLIRMPDLKQIFENIGLTRVETYIQSGNVVFCQDRNFDHQDLEIKIETAIADDYKLKVPVLIRSLNELTKILNANPFLDHPGINTEKLYVTFLKNTPVSSYIEKIKEFQFPPDEFIVSGKEVFVHCPDRYGETKISNAFFEHKLKVSATTRNWKTLHALATMAKKH